MEEPQSSILEAASELMAGRHYSQVVAACHSELQVDPDNVDLRLLLAQALMALRRDGEAQVEVAAALRSRPRCPEAYKLLGELAFRRDELRAASIFLREALRFAPTDEHAQVLLGLVESRKQPAAAAAKLPAASAAAGPSSRRLARGTEPAPMKALQTAPAPFRALEDDEIPVHDARPQTLDDVEIEPDDELASTTERRRKPGWILPKTDPGEPTVQASRMEEMALRLNPGASGFGEFLVARGILSRWQLYCALHLQDWKHVRLGEAVVRLGFAEKRTVERALRAYHEALQSPRIA